MFIHKLSETIQKSAILFSFYLLLPSLCGASTQSKVVCDPPKGASRMAKLACNQLAGQVDIRKTAELSFDDLNSDSNKKNFPTSPYFNRALFSK